MAVVQFVVAMGVLGDGPARVDAGDVYPFVSVGRGHSGQEWTISRSAYSWIQFGAFGH